MKSPEVHFLQVVRDPQGLDARPWIGPLRQLGTAALALERVYVAVALQPSCTALRQTMQPVACSCNPVHPWVIQR